MLSAEGAGLCTQILRAYTAIVGTCQWLQRASLPAPATLRTTGPAGSNGLSGEWLVWQFGPVAEPSLVLGPTQNKQLFEPLSTQDGVAQPNEDPVASEISRGDTSSLIVGESRCNHLSFTLEGILEHAPPMGPLEIPTTWKDLKLFRFVSYRLTHKCLTHGAEIKCELLLTCSLGAVSIMSSV